MGIQINVTEHAAPENAATLDNATLGLTGNAFSKQQTRDEIAKVNNTAIKGIAGVTSSPTPYSASEYPDGLFEKWEIITDGTYTNFLDSNSSAIQVTSQDLDGQFCYLYVNNGVTEKVTIPFQQVTSTSTLNIIQNGITYSEGSSFANEEGTKIYTVLDGQTFIAGTDSLDDVTKLEVVFQGASIMKNISKLENEVLLNKQVNSTGALINKADWHVAKIDVSDFAGKYVTWGNLTTSNTTINSVFYDNSDVIIGTKTTYSTAEQPITEQVPNNGKWLFINIKSAIDAVSVYENFKVINGTELNPKERVKVINGLSVINPEDFASSVQKLEFIMLQNRQVNSNGGVALATDWKVAKIDVSAFVGQRIVFGGLKTEQEMINTVFYDNSDVIIGSKIQVKPYATASKLQVPVGAKWFYINIKHANDPENSFENFHTFIGNRYDSADVKNIAGEKLAINRPSFLNINPKTAIVILQTGQSNMTEQASNTPVPPEDLLPKNYLWRWQYADQRFIRYAPTLSGHNVNLRLATILEKYEQNVFFINYAVSGTEISKHIESQDGSVDAIFWQRVQDGIADLQASGYLPVVYLLFNQGEADSNAQPTTDAYEANLDLWINQWKSRLGDGLPIIMNGIYETDAMDVEINRVKRKAFLDGKIKAFYPIDLVNFPSDDDLHRNYEGYQVEGDVLFSILCSIGSGQPVVDNLPYNI